MKYIFQNLRLSAVLAISIAALFLPSAVLSQSLPRDAVVKAPGSPDIYYVGLNGKRYKIPDPETYFTWFKSFDIVQSISDALADKITAGFKIESHKFISLHNNIERFVLVKH